MSGSKLFQRVCKAKSLDEAVRSLSQADLGELAEYLSELKPEGGIPSQVFGMVTAALGKAPRKAKEVAK